MCLLKIISSFVPVAFFICALNLSAADAEPSQPTYFNLDNVKAIAINLAHPISAFNNTMLIISEIYNVLSGEAFDGIQIIVDQQAEEMIEYNLSQTRQGQ
ncbi:MAG TPA: hypothetical protein VEK06_03480 [Myxococcota bacterium]|nr:hypothetical protein [Myxococcota bacterium]